MRHPALKAYAVLAALLALPHSATAASSLGSQDPSDPHRMSASAGFSTEEAVSGRWQTVEFFVHPNRSIRLPDGLPWIEYSARRVSGERGEPGEATWADSRSCPAMRNTLIWMTGLVAPQLEVPGISPPSADPVGRRPIRMTVDGLHTKVWGSGTQPDHTMGTRVEISSNGGLIAEFGLAATANLAGCWTSQEPDFAK